MSPEPTEADYVLVRVLGQGGSATTWLATDKRTGEKCALKKIHLHQLADWKELERFEREVKTLRHLDHPGIPRFIAAWQQSEPPEAVLVQQYVEGQNLKQWLEDGRRFREEEVVEIALQITGILSYLHSFSPPVLHRDIKPSNLMFDKQGKVFLVDFDAVARSLAGQGMTVTGTFGYMPLEQIEGKAVPASDLYALGMSLLHLLTGQPPSEMKKQGLKPDFRAYTRLSKGLEKILDKLIEPDPAHRYTSAAALHKDLLRLTAPPAMPLPWLRVIAWKKLLPVGALALLIVLVVFALGRKPHKPRFVSRTSQIVTLNAVWQPVNGHWVAFEDAPRIEKLIENPAGEIWAISDTKLYKFASEKVQMQESRDLTGSYGSLDYLASPAADEAWFATYDGKLYRWQGDQSRAIETQAPVKALASWRGSVVAAWGKEVFVWRDDKFASIGTLPEEVEHLFGQGEGLWASAGRRLLAYDGQNWKQLFGSENYDERVRSLSQANGKLWLGLEKGLIELDTARNLTSRLGGAGPITSMLVQPGKGLWSVSTAVDAAGLNRLEPGTDKWRSLGWREGLPDDRFEAMLLDKQGRLWLSAASGELWRAPITEVEKAIARPPAAIIPALRFEDACQAWQGVKPDSVPMLAGEILDGDLRVFWNQQQICPLGEGFRRADGAVLFAAGKGLKLKQNGRLSDVPLPRDYLSVTDLLLARNGDIWISHGFPPQIQRRRSEQWESSVMPKGHAHKELLETASGYLLATMALEKHLPLHSFDGRSWTSLKTASDGYVSPEGMSLFTGGSVKDQVALATDKGLYLVGDFGTPGPSILQVADLPYSHVRRAVQDAQGNVWIIYSPYGKSRGLTRWNPSTGKIRHLDARSGLVPDRFADLAIDSRGNLWLQHHDRDVSVYTRQNLEKALK